ncbi:uncharacterized protein V1516DRAFT_250290 [Lipomyces oligophaga]|uniref:uncharacterized protein n=1 Tax=Lipomyces oligophaga TaxID=45792 RepID=UPI0034CF1855
MYGDAAAKLALDARRAQSLDSITEHHTELVSVILREIRDLYRDYALLREKLKLSTASQTPDTPESSPKNLSGAIFILQLCLRRNKRVLLAYHRLRAKKIDNLVWLAADSTALPSSLDAHDLDYFRAQSSLISELNGTWAEIDLAGSIEPPKDLFVDVRVLKDAGEIQTEYGVLSLTKNSQFYVRLADVDRLISQGYLARLS